MKLEDLKGKTIDDAMLADLLAFAKDLTEQRDAARQESISGRKGKDAKIAELTARIAALSDWAGVDDDADLAALPQPKGQMEAAKQFEARLKRAERERQEAQAALEQLNGRFTQERKSLALEKAIASQAFIDADVARAMLERSVQVEGEDFFYAAPDGKLLPLADGASLLAKTKPYLVKAPSAGAQGSGFRGDDGNAAAGGGSNLPTLDLRAIYAARKGDTPKQQA